MARILLKNQAYENLKRMILSNQISYEQPITELELSKRLKMGRAPIREALNLLSKDGLIRLIPNKGAVLQRFSLHDLIQIYQIREVLDPLASKLSIGRINLAELERIKKKFLNKKKISWDSGRQFSEELHSIIYQSCGNSFLLGMFENLALRIAVGRHSLWNIWIRKVDIDAIKKRNQEHAEIITVLEEGNVKKVEILTRKHISNTISQAIGWLKEGG